MTLLPIITNDVAPDASHGPPLIANTALLPVAISLVFATPLSAAAILVMNIFDG